MKDNEYDLADLQSLQLVKNLESIIKEKNLMCKFRSLIMFIFFYSKIYFPTVGNIVWQKGKLTTKKIVEYIPILEEIF